MADVMKFVLKHYSQVKSCLPPYNLEHIFTTSEMEDLQPQDCSVVWTTGSCRAGDEEMRLLWL